MQRITLKGNKTFIGKIKDNQMTGFGQLVDHNTGQTLQGNFENGSLNGMVLVIEKDGTRYYESYKDGQRQLDKKDRELYTQLEEQFKQECISEGVEFEKTEPKQIVEEVKVEIKEVVEEEVVAPPPPPTAQTAVTPPPPPPAETAAAPPPPPPPAPPAPPAQPEEVEVKVEVEVEVEEEPAIPPPPAPPSQPEEVEVKVEVEEEAAVPLPPGPAEEIVKPEEVELKVEVEVEEEPEEPVRAPIPPPPGGPVNEILKEEVVEEDDEVICLPPPPPPVINPDYLEELEAAELAVEDLEVEELIEEAEQLEEKVYTEEDYLRLPPPPPPIRNPDYVEELEAAELAVEDPEVEEDDEVICLPPPPPPIMNPDYVGGGPDELEIRYLPTPPDPHYEEIEHYLHEDEEESLKNISTIKGNAQDDEQFVEKNPPPPPPITQFDTAGSVPPPPQGLPGVQEDGGESDDDYLKGSTASDKQKEAQEKVEEDKAIVEELEGRREAAVEKEDPDVVEELDKEIKEGVKQTQKDARKAAEAEAEKVEEEQAAKREKQQKKTLKKTRTEPPQKKQPKNNNQSTAALRVLSNGDLITKHIEQVKYSGQRSPSPTKWSMDPPTNTKSSARLTADPKLNIAGHLERLEVERFIENYYGSYLKKNRQQKFDEKKQNEREENEYYQDLLRRVRKANGPIKKGFNYREIFEMIKKDQKYRQSIKDAEMYSLQKGDLVPFSEGIGDTQIHKGRRKAVKLESSRDDPYKITPGYGSSRSRSRSLRSGSRRSRSRSHKHLVTGSGRKRGFQKSGKKSRKGHGKKRSLYKSPRRSPRRFGSPSKRSKSRRNLKNKNKKFTHRSPKRRATHQHPSKRAYAAYSKTSPNAKKRTMISNLSPHRYHEAQYLNALGDYSKDMIRQRSKERSEKLEEKVFSKYLFHPAAYFQRKKNRNKDKIKKYDYDVTKWNYPNAPEEHYLSKGLKDGRPDIKKKAWFKLHEEEAYWRDMEEKYRRDRESGNLRTKQRANLKVKRAK